MCCANESAVPTAPPRGPRSSENDLRAQLQLPRVVGRSDSASRVNGRADFAERRVCYVTRGRSQNDGIKNVERLGAEFNSAVFTPERELPKDRCVKIPERR